MLESTVCKLAPRDDQPDVSVGTGKKVRSGSPACPEDLGGCGGSVRSGSPVCPEYLGGCDGLFQSGSPACPEGLGGCDESDEQDAECGVLSDLRAWPDEEGLAGVALSQVGRRASPPVRQPRWRKTASRDRS